MRVYKKLFDKITDLENLFWAWYEFKHDKGKKIDVLRFEKNLETELFGLYRDLRNKSYRHGGYSDFYICDPKLRHIFKATVRDRILHHAIYRILNPVFEPTFIPTSFSCRTGKGTHKGVEVVESMIRKISRNYTQHCYVLKCDVRKFFDTIDHSILLDLIRRKIQDKDLLWLLEEVIGSYISEQAFFNRIGLPIGNLTSQLFANIYMNEFDQFMKQELKVRFYARYTDDFIVVSDGKEYLDSLIQPITEFLREHLHLQLHPNKVEILNVYKTVDFLGYSLRPHHRLMRKRTLKRLRRKLKEKFESYSKGQISQESFDQTLQSYLGVLSHANTHKLSQELQNHYWFWRSKDE